MNVRTALLAGLMAGALTGMAPLASAQTGGAAAPVVTQGPPITGYCVYFQNEVIGASKVGQSYIARLNVLASQIKAELQPQADSLVADRKALETSASSLDQATLQARGNALQQRYAAFERMQQQREQEMQATQRKQLQVIGTQLDPVVREVYQQRHCSILVDGDSGVRAVNPQMDLSQAIVAALDLRIQTLTFDREHLEAGAAAPAR